MRPTVVILGELYDPAAEDHIAEHAELVKVDPDDAAAVAAALPRAHGLIAKYPAPITAEVLAAAPNLVAVLSSGRGVDNIDIPAATAAGVVIANNPGLGGRPVSEHALGLMITISRDLHAVTRLGIEGAWERRLTTTRVELADSTLGIVGLGNVGSNMAHRAARGFGMTVLAYDPYVSAEEMAEHGATKVDDLFEMLGQADFVTCHPEMNDETEHMFDDAAFAAMKPGAYFVNTSRGRVVDTDALVRALRSGHLAAAAMDVYEEEPLDPASPLLGMDNVALTAHVADFTVQTKTALAFSAATKVLGALAGEVPPSALNPQAWDAADRRRKELLGG
ncbi:NAD(P)-dependent oxidoreductase [Actinokineospora bangkokensis]|uniref:Hydroxyacid dehydrogenase n=1 Tax=Actinokineospora bangkokensis TaxID=1193682 RepID=A0A1Q9LJN4_9PSEU|nr:NAD(P)-dependent oxidoreductase [Actinokineospora bangkokensis]OLR92238.1 hydroxyacid dehydrogenase [Actinokineospora bangkokensis]